MNNKPETKIFLFLFVQLLSLVGSKVCHVAIGFWIYDKSRSIMDFSLVLLCSFLPNIISSFLSGPLVDRFHFRKTFGAGDIVSAGIMLLTALLVLFWRNNFGYLYATIFAVSALSALQWVSLNAYLPEVLSDDSRIKATGWLSTAASMATLLAASLASLLLAAVGMHAILIFSTAAYLISAYVVFFVLPEGNRAVAASKGGTFYSDFKAGVQYLRSQQELFALVMLFAAFNFFAGVNTNLITPLFLERYTVKYAGYVLGFLAAGSLVTGLVLTRTTRLAVLRHKIPLLMLAIFIENALIGYFPAPWLAIMIMFSLGTTITLVNTSTTLVLQENVSSDYRGRIFATARGISWVAIPVAQVICGTITDTLFRRFFSNVSRSSYLGNTFLAVNTTASLFFLGYLYFGKKLEFKKAQPQVVIGA